MTQLILQPTLSEQTREEIEAHVEEVRARRIVAAIEYFQGKNAKLANVADKLRRRLEGEYVMLEKEIARMDSALAKVEQRLIRIEELKSEAGQATDAITTGMIEDEED